MSDSEDDYMSDKILASCEKHDIRPGLVHNKAEKRKIDIYKKKLQASVPKKPKSYIQKERETREKGLSTAISSENKGFKLLQKMGYQPGSSLGKTTPGIVEPINVLVKEDASGVGRESHVKEVIDKKQKIKEQKLQRIEKEFKASYAEKKFSQNLRKDMSQAQRICEELDFRANITEPIQDFYWTSEAIKRLKADEDSNDSDEEEEEEEYEPTEEDLKIVIDYVRTKHYYCIYCAINCDSEEELNSFCPGPYRENHDD